MKSRNDSTVKAWPAAAPFASSSRVPEVPRINDLQEFCGYLNLPYLGVKRALGEISDNELGALRSRIRPGRTALRYFDQLEWDPSGT